MAEELVEEATVVETGPDGVLVRLDENDACEECTARLFCTPGDGQTRLLPVVDLCGVRPGDRVLISLEGKRLLSATFALYGIPLALFLAGMAGGMILFAANRELWASLLGFGLVAGYGLAVFFRSRSKPARPLARIVSVQTSLQLADRPALFR